MRLKTILFYGAGIALMLASVIGAAVNYGDGPMNHPAFLPMALVLFAIPIIGEVRDWRKRKRFEAEMDEKWRRLREEQEKLGI
jgi:hypothetical protein